MFLGKNIMWYHKHIYIKHYDLSTIVGFQYLTDVEEHLGVSIPETDCSMKVEASEFDGKVVYGEKRSNKG